MDLSKWEAAEVKPRYVTELKSNLILIWFIGYLRAGQEGLRTCQFPPYTEAVQGNAILASLGADLDSAAA